MAIPARLNSKRLPSKVMLDINGKTMLQRVVEAAAGSYGHSSVVLCAEDSEILDHANKMGCHCLVTPSNCSSGSERIASVLDQIVAIAYGKPTAASIANDNEYLEKLRNTIVLNIQCDQPFINQEFFEELNKAITNLQNDFPPVLTPVYRLQDIDVFDESIVKVVFSQSNRALYFSRATIPYQRDVEPDLWSMNADYWGHVGIYAFRADVLHKWSDFSSSCLEGTEKLEQLRLLESDIAIRVFKTSFPPASIDTIEDLERLNSSQSNIIA